VEGIIKTKQNSGGSFDSYFVDWYLSLYPPLNVQKKSRRSRRNEVESWIRILRQAESILMFVGPNLHLGERGVSPALDILKETAHALLCLAEGGRTAEIHLGQCANSLGEIFKKETGSYHWKWVGQAMEKRFPEAFKAEDDGARDVTLWAYNLAKRYRLILTDHARLQKSDMRNARGRIRERLVNPHPKTISAFFPSLLKIKGAKFWPDELSAHHQQSCSMCIERAERAKLGRHSAVR
jgi:hypothetical protein